MRRVVFAGTSLLALTAPLWASPSLLIISRVRPNNMSADGNVIIGGSTDVFRYTATPTPTFEYVPGASNQDVAYCDASGLIMTSTVQNTAGVGGLPTNRTIVGRWDDPNVGWENLGIVPMGSNCDFSISNPYDISENGRFIVGLHWINGCSARAFIYDHDTQVMTNLGSLFGVSTRANAVSEDGSVVCGFEHNPFTSRRRPAVWENGVETILPTTATVVTEAGEAYIVNRDGTVIYGESDQYPNSLVKWVRVGPGNWTQVDCGQHATPPTWAGGAAITGYIPTAISDDGNTVVGATRFGGAFAAFIYTNGGGFTDVTDLMSGVPGASDVGLFEVAADVSADGRQVLGFARILGLNWKIDLDGNAPCVPPLQTEPPSDMQQDPNVGLFLVFNAAIIGSTDVDYQWYKNGAPIMNTPDPYDPNDPNSFTSIKFGATTQQLFIDNVQCIDNGVYHCVVSNACGTVTIGPVLGTVGELCPGDINGDRVVDLSDLAGLLANFGMSGRTTPQGDLTGDGNVDLSDLAGMLAEFGNSCICFP